MADASSVYIETTVISYLTARPVRDAIVAGQMAATRKWWDHSRRTFDVRTSELVVAEASAGDPQAAAERLAVLATLSRIPVTDDARELAKLLIRKAALPARASVDALHVAIAAYNTIDYLLTWNCRHLANATLRTRIERVCRDEGIKPPLICTPPELTEVLP